MSKYTYKRLTSEAIELSEENERTVQEFLELVANDIRKTVKELKDAGYTDKQIDQAFKINAAQFGVQSYRPGGIVAGSFMPEIKVVDGVPVCANGNPSEIVIDADELKKALGL